MIPHCVDFLWVLMS